MTVHLPTGPAGQPPPPPVPPGATPPGAAPLGHPQAGLSGQPVTRTPVGGAARTAGAITPPALEAVDAAGVAATPGGSPPPHASLPRHLTPEARTAAFEAVKAEAGKPVYKEPGKPSSTERFAQDFVEDAIAEMSGQQRDYPRMSINVWVSGVRRTYTVEQHGNAIRVIGHRANEQEVLTKVLQKVQTKEGNAKEGETVFDADTLATCVANSQDEDRVRTLTHHQVQQALVIGQLALTTSGFVGALQGKIQDPEEYVSMAFERLKTTYAAKQVFRPISPGTPSQPSLVPPDVRHSFAKIIHAHYQRMTGKPDTSKPHRDNPLAQDEDEIAETEEQPTPPAATPPPINEAAIRGIASSGSVRFYKASVWPETECFGNYHVLEGGRRVFGCITSEGAFLSKKYGFAANDPANPFKDATEYTSPSLSDLNTYYGDSPKKKITGHNLPPHPLGRLGPVEGWDPDHPKTVADPTAPGGSRAVVNGNIEAMHSVLKEKFERGKEHDALLATDTAELVEQTEIEGKDEVWATSPSGKGENRLGRLLMQVRAELGGSPYTDSGKTQWK